MAMIERGSVSFSVSPRVSGFSLPSVAIGTARHRTDKISDGYTLSSAKCQSRLDQESWTRSHPPTRALIRQVTGCRRTLGGRAWEISQSNSEQVDSPQELLKAMVGAIAIKDRIDGEVVHPDSAIAIRGLQPFECVLIAFQRCVDLSQPVG